MIFQPFGAARTVTGSMHLITINGNRILLDCGLFQGKRTEAYIRNKDIPFDPKSINAIILSHAHIDHSGNLPSLVRNGFRGPIYSTEATRDLCNIMLYDTAYIQERDIEYVNKKHVKRHEPVVQPLYDVVDVTDAMQQVIGVEYGHTIEVGKGVRATFLDAGHILGSTITYLELEENGHSVHVGFTGDLGRKNMPIIKDPQPLREVDVLISECTYGGKIHDPITGMKDSLFQVIQKTCDRGGKVIIPSFSVGRTQEVVYLLHELFDEGKLPAIPIYIDSPLAVNASEVFRQHPECFDAETVALLQANDDPFGFHRLIYIRTVEQSKELNGLKQPCVIISASGMCEGGRVVHHLVNNIENPINTILFVGYQAEHTLGRRLIEKQPEVSIFGDVLKVKAEIIVLNSFSAHAGQDELVEYVENIDKSALKKIILVHGEIAQAEKLREKLIENTYSNILIPQRGDRIELPS